MEVVKEVVPPTMVISLGDLDMEAEAVPPTTMVINLEDQDMEVVKEVVPPTMVINQTDQDLQTAMKLEIKEVLTNQIDQNINQIGPNISQTDHNINPIDQNTNQADQYIQGRVFEEMYRTTRQTVDQQVEQGYQEFKKKPHRWAKDQPPVCLLTSLTNYVEVTSETLRRLYTLNHQDRRIDTISVKSIFIGITETLKAVNTVSQDQGKHWRCISFITIAGMAIKRKLPNTMMVSWFLQCSFMRTLKRIPGSSLSRTT